MQTFVRFRAGKLVAGIGVILAGTLSGCWDAQKRPAGPTNFPKGTLNTGAAGQSGNNSGAFSGTSNSNTGGAPVNRTTGNPPFVDQGRAGGPLSSNAVGPANSSLLSPPVNSGPIATNGSAARSGIQPANANFGPAPAGSGKPGDLVAPPDNLPVKDSDLAASSLPTVPPISTQGQDPKTRFRRQSPPPIPEDALTPPPSLPGKGGSLPPPAAP